MRNDKIQTIVQRLLTTWNLEMTDPAQLRPAKVLDPRFEMRRAEVPCPELNRFLYTAVGGDWFWVDRLPWTYDRWMQWLDRPELETWVAMIGGNPAGYYELEHQPGHSVEIAYFGLMPQFVGKGLGGMLLTAATRRGWEMGARRVWVHTCSLDHPNALAAYQARGFRLFLTESETIETRDQPVGPWPGAR